MADDIDLIAAALRGMKPFTPGKDVPQDVGLGGPSTEYLAGSTDERGNGFNYPTIWWIGGQPVLLSPDDAYQKAIAYEAATGQYFPRYRNDEAASFAAENRSALGGASMGPLATMNPGRNF